MGFPFSDILGLFKRHITDVQVICMVFLPHPRQQVRRGGPNPAWLPGFRETTLGVHHPVKPGSPSPDSRMPGAETSLENLSDTGLEMESTVHFQKVVSSVDPQTVGRTCAI